MRHYNTITLKNLLLMSITMISIMFSMNFMYETYSIKKSTNIIYSEKLCRVNLKLDVKNVSVFKNRIIIMCKDGKDE